MRLFAALALSAGIASAGHADEAAMPLSGTAWIVTAIAGTTLPEGLYPDLAFGGARVSGFGGCNRLMGSYSETAEGEVRIGPLAATRMACPPPRMEVEAAFLAALDRVDRAEITEDRVLQLRAGDEILIEARVMD